MVFNPNVIILSMFIIAGLMTTVWGWRIVARGRVTQRWPRVDGVISRADPNSETDNLLPHIEFSYVVAGSTYQHTIDFSGDAPPSPELNASYLRKYPIGAKVHVSYNPTHPQHVTLEPGVGKGDWAVLAFGILISVFGVLFLWFGA